MAAWPLVGSPGSSLHPLGLHLDRSRTTSWRESHFPSFTWPPVAARGLLLTGSFIQQICSAPTLSQAHQGAAPPLPTALWGSHLLQVKVQAGCTHLQGPAHLPYPPPFFPFTHTAVPPTLQGHCCLRAFASLCPPWECSSLQLPHPPPSQ